jgi:hypothetical protein
MIGNMEVEMKNKILALIASSALMVPYSAIASHAYISPAATPSIVFTGLADVQKGLTITGCDVTLTLSGPENAPDGHSVSHTDFTNLTPTLQLANGTLGLCSHPALYVMSIGSTSLTAGGAFKLNNVQIHTITGAGCEGDLDATWSGGSLVFSGSLPEANPSLTGNAPDGNPCVFTGAITPSVSVAMSAPGDSGH